MTFKFPERIILFKRFVNVCESIKKRAFVAMNDHMYNTGLIVVHFPVSSTHNATVCLLQS